jgi:hypothetical protein
LHFRFETAFPVNLKPKTFPPAPKPKTHKPTKPPKPPKPNFPNRNSAQDRLLSKGEVELLKAAGYDIHEIKGGKGASKYDLYKDPQGNIYVKRKGSAEEGDPTGININDI